MGLTRENQKAIEIINQAAREKGLNIDGGRVRRTSSRFCLSVEHGDYNGTELFGVGTDRFIWFAYRPNGTKKMRLYSCNFPDDGVIEFNIGEDIPAPKSPEIAQTWGRFPLGLEYLRREVASGGLLKEIQFLRDEIKGVEQGIDAVVFGNIPGGGMSRSGSLCTNKVLSLFDANGIEISTHEQKLGVVDLAQAIENVYIGSPCGKLDQTMILFAKEGMGTRYNPKDRSIEHVPFGGDINSFRLVSLDTGTDRPGLEKSTYALRRRECERLVEILQAMNYKINCLADIRDEDVYNRIMAEQITGEYLGTVSTDIGRAVEIKENNLKARLKYIFEAQKRFYKMMDAWKAGDIAEVGKLFRADGIGLRDDYKISGPELETMCDIARSVSGVLGERMLGGGDKGASGAIVSPEVIVPILTGAIKLGYGLSYPDYAEKCAVHVCKVVEGVKVFDVL